MEARKLAAGELITEAGVYDLSMAQYHGQPCEGPSVSSSGLRTIWSQSPAHYWIQSSLNPHRIEQGERPHFSLGRAAHHLIFLGRKGFDAEFVVRPDKWKDWRTNDAKEWKAEMLAAGLTIITDAELEAITGMARSLAEHPMVKAGILDGAVERSLIWKDAETGAWLKSRPDVIPSDSGDYADLKTTVSVATDALRRTIAEYAYPMQGALVGMASREVLKREMQTFTLVFVEKTPPYCARVVTLRPDDLERGERQVRAAAETFAECIASGQWPGPGGLQQDAEYLSPSEWAQRSIDERLELFAADNDARPSIHAAE
jgi:hypothetical protein